MWRPELRFDRIEHLTPGLLRRHGIEALLVDLDETLLPAERREVEPSVVRWAESLRAAGVPIAIVSNGRPERVRAARERLGVPGRAWCGKPLPGAYRRALRQLGVAPERCAMVGDQLFTDLLGAHLAGIRTVLVEPRSSGGMPHTRLLRYAESVLLGGGVRGRPHHW